MTIASTMTAIEIEQITKEELMSGPFPYEDCRWLSRVTGVDTGDLIPELDLFLSEIVGFGCKATSMHYRDKKQLEQHLPLMRKSLAERFPSWKGFLERVNENDTPKLANQIHFAEIVRTELLPLMNARLTQ